MCLSCSQPGEGVHLTRFWSGTCHRSFRNIPVPYTKSFEKSILDLIPIFRKSISNLIFHTKTLKIGTVPYTKIVKIDTVLYTNIWTIDLLAILQFIRELNTGEESRIELHSVM